MSEISDLANGLRQGTEQPYMLISQIPIGMDYASTPIHTPQFSWIIPREIALYGTVRIVNASRSYHARSILNVSNSHPPTVTSPGAGWS
jgi:hypothetical protein